MGGGRRANLGLVLRFTGFGGESTVRSTISTSFFTTGARNLTAIGAGLSTTGGTAFTTWGKGDLSVCPLFT